MHRVAINAINAKTGGGKSIVANYMTLLNNSNLDDQYFVLTANASDFEWINNDRIKIISVPKWWSRTVAWPYVAEILLKRVLDDHQVELLFNLGNLVRTDITQVYLFQWAYATLNPDNVVWKRLNWKTSIRVKAKIATIKRLIRLPSVVIAQTKIAKKDLESLYGLRNVKIVPNAVDLGNIYSGDEKDFNLPSGKRLVYLANYYQHKNLEILLPVARKIRELRLDYRIVITIAAGHRNGSDRLLREISDQKLEDIIVNVGTVDRGDVPSLYRSCQGLLMPSLLESFSGTYVEAMYYRIPIFTSGLDFAREVCGEGATYFDPHDPDDILEKIERVFREPTRLKALVDAGEKVLRLFPDWPKVFALYQNIICDELRENRS